MRLSSYARVAMWFGLVVAMGTVVTMVLAPRTWPMLVAPRPTAEAVRADTRPAWQMALDTMDRALAAADISGADMAWRDAYGLAIRSRQWEALLAAGDGSLRIADHALVKQPYQTQAREAWLAALFRARAQRSVDGVLRVAEGFGRLGDAEALTQTLRLAEGLAAADPSGEAQRRVLAVRNRLIPAAASAATRG